MYILSTEVLAGGTKHPYLMEYEMYTNAKGIEVGEYQQL